MLQVRTENAFAAAFVLFLFVSTRSSRSSRFAEQKPCGASLTILIHVTNVPLLFCSGAIGASSPTLSVQTQMLSSISQRFPHKRQ